MVDINLSAISEIVAIILSSLCYIIMEPLALGFNIGYDKDVLAGAAFVQLLLELGLEMVVDLSAMWAETEHEIPVLDYFRRNGSVPLFLMMAFDALMAFFVAINGFIRYPTVFTCSSHHVCDCIDQDVYKIWYADACNNLTQALYNDTDKASIINGTQLPSQDMFDDVDVNVVFAVLIAMLLAASIVYAWKMMRSYQHQARSVKTVKGTLRRYQDTFKVQLQDMVTKQMEEQNANECLNLLLPYKVPRNHVKMKRRIGKGAYGSVWKASCNGIVVAAKKLCLQEGSEVNDVVRFRDECNMMAELQKCGGKSHDNLVQMLFVCWEAELLLLLSYYELRDLDSILNIARHLGDTDLRWTEQFSWNCDGKPPMLSVAIGITFGIEYVHKHDIIHRDLKPGNILIEGTRDDPVIDWNPRLADFGTARVLANDKNDEMTQVGTPYYVAPEVMRDGIYDVRADIYSFGIVLLDLAAYAHGGVRSLWDTPFSIVRVLNGERPQIPDDGTVPDYLASIIEACWHDNPSKRPKNFGELRKLLMRIPWRREPVLDKATTPNGGAGEDVTQNT